MVIAQQLPAEAQRTGRRLAWLDALRGIAALLVVYEHALKPLMPEAGALTGPWFATGWFGVVVFFLVSGYIVPASLERRGDVRAFWIGRVFRLYPLWAVCVLGALVLAATGLDPLHVWNSGRPLTAALGHLSMMQDLLAVPNVVNVLWTLSYEMAFYLLLTAMFTLGVNRFSSGAALAFTLVAVLGAGVLPSVLWSHGYAATLVVVLAALAGVGAGLAGVLWGTLWVRRAAAVLLAGVVLALLAFNGRMPAWQSMIILATMFSGTVLYRAESGQIPWRAAWVVALVPVASVWLFQGTNERLATAAAWATFAVGMAMRHRAVPRMLAWLGMISYSLYLLHPLLLETVDGLLPDPAELPLGWRLALLVAVLGALVALSALTWRLVEKPAQRLGKRLASGGG